MGKILHLTVEKKNTSIYDSKIVYKWDIVDLPSSVFVVENTSSVLDDAWACVAQNKLPVWGSIIAQSQDFARGQMRRKWYSPVGNLYVALRLPMEEPFIDIVAAPAFSTLLIMAMHFLGYRLYLKWPNDLVLDTGVHKVGGVLLEEKQNILIAGIGINILKAPEEDFLRKDHAFLAGTLPSVKGLKDNITLLNNSVFSNKNSLAEAFWLQLVRNIYFCYKNKMFTPYSWKNMAEKFLLWKGKYIEIDDGQRKVGGILCGLGKLGELLVNVNGQVMQYTNASIRFYKR